MTEGFAPSLKNDCADGKHGDHNKKPAHSAKRANPPNKIGANRRDGDGERNADRQTFAPIGVAEPEEIQYIACEVAGPDEKWEKCKNRRRTAYDILNSKLPNGQRQPLFIEMTASAPIYYSAEKARKELLLHESATVRG